MLGRQMLPRATPQLRTSFIIPRSTFTTTFIQQKTATETAKDVLKKADRVVSDELVEGIEKGRTYHSSVLLLFPRSHAGYFGTMLTAYCFNLTTSEALKNAASELAGIKTEKAAAQMDANMAEVKDKATEMKGVVQGKVSEMEGEGEAKGTYEEVRVKM